MFIWYTRRNLWSERILKFKLAKKIYVNNAYVTEVRKKPKRKSQRWTY